VTGYSCDAKEGDIITKIRGDLDVLSGGLGRGRGRPKELNSLKVSPSFDPSSPEKEKKSRKAQSIV